MIFSEFSGNSLVKEQLLELYNSNRMPHALLLNGPEGSGHFQIGLSLAALLLCQSPNQSNSCGNCSSCKKIASFHHPDLHFSFPIHLSKTEHNETSDDLRSVFVEMLIKFKCIGRNNWYNLMGNPNKQGVIGVKESQAVLKKINLKAYEGGAKVLIIWLAEMMNNQAANKLLKLIEEPPDKTYFIFITDQKEKLLPTISSRLQHLDISALNSDEIENYLVNQFQIEKKKASEYAMHANGNLNRAINLHLDSEYLNQKLPVFIQWMRLCYTRNIADTIDWVNDFSKTGREQIKDFFSYSLELFRQCVLGHYSIDKKGLSIEEKNFLEKFSPFINHNNIEELHEVLNEAYYHMERNANSKILLLDVSLKLFKLLKNANPTQKGN